MFLQLLDCFLFVSGLFMSGVSLTCIDELRHPETSPYTHPDTLQISLPLAMGLLRPPKTKRRGFVPVRLPLGKIYGGDAPWGLTPLQPYQLVQVCCKWMHHSLIGIISSYNVF